MTSTDDSGFLTQTSAAVLQWGMPRLRDLPWRATRDPWAVLVSEVMLQQTQVARVIPKWFAFMAAHPTPEACAATSLGDVLRTWQGLGYPRRARNLHAAATEVSRLGDFPTTIDGLLALPGVGQYTARAVLVFAFEADEAVVDTNIARIYARTAGRRLTAKEVQRLADASVPDGEGWAWNQCLMDLGAALCRPIPRCGECPLRAGCAWGGSGADPVTDPAIGSAGVSRPQARFEGSERQARGRLLKALGNGRVHIDAVPSTMAHPAALRLIESLDAEGLIVRDGDWLLLP